MGNLTCPEHGVEWFKRGKMKNYAHPIGDTGKWCNMPKEEDIFPDEEVREEPKLQRDFSRPTVGRADTTKEVIVKDPDWDAIRDAKQTSIEGQYISGMTKDLWIAGKLKDDSDEAKMLRLIIIDRLEKFCYGDNTTRVKEAIKEEVDKIPYPETLIDEIRATAKAHGFWDETTKKFNTIKFEKFLELHVGKPVKAAELPKLPLETLDKIKKLLDNM